jgi:hypothetical protein
MVDPASPTDDREQPALTVEEVARHELQAILGQLHGFMSKAVEHPSEWCPPPLIDSVATAYRDIGRAFGDVQASLNSGAHDARLASWGLAGDQMVPKKTGFWHALRQFFAPTRNNEPPFLGALGSVVRWGGVIVGSLSREIPGGEVLKEFLDVIGAAREQFREMGQAKPPASSARSRGLPT